ncbi:MAG: hypothetical protein OXI15_05790 [Chromatiales bacterium]|nr:hypothetical protein [Chromatiales bacterium]
MRQRERRKSIIVATGVAAEFLVTAAAAVVMTEPTKRNETEREAAVKKATAQLRGARSDRRPASASPNGMLFGVEY